MFEYLLKFSPAVYAQGQWHWRWQPALFLILLFAICILLFAIFCYTRTASPLRRNWRSTLIALRFTAIALILFCLLEPVLSVSTTVPRKSSVLVLVDDSKSMSIEDAGRGDSRREQVAGWLGSEQGALASLGKNFRLETFRFANQVSPMASLKDLRGDGPGTDLAHALEFAAKQAQKGALSGVILITDGVASQGGDPLPVAAKLATQKIPLFTVGVGAKVAHDVQIAKVEAQRSVLENSAFEISALVQNRGLANRTVTLELRDNDGVVQSQSVRLGERSTRVTMQVAPDRKGFMKYTLAVPPLSGESVVANNELSFLVNTRDRTARVLFVEELHGWEFKFIRRAMDSDNAILLTSLTRTGPEKFYRQGLRHQDELRNGFPANRRELFGYEAIILGSVPAKDFTDAQFALLRDFVVERGGGLLMLGGPKGLAQGGYATTPLIDLLPVELGDAGAIDAQGLPQLAHERFSLALTTEALSSSILQLDPDPLVNRQRWEQMPKLSGYNPLGQAKPGASVLGVHPLHTPASPRIIFATERVGRGRSAVLATSSTWKWRMGLSHTDQSPERFWRQLMRWLSLQAPEPVSITLERENYAPGETVTMTIEACDSSFTAQREAQLSVQMKNPDGRTQLLDASPVLGRPGVFEANVAAQANGLYQIEVLADGKDGKLLGRAASAFFVEPSRAELANADLQSSLLQRMAEISGGRYFHISEAGQLSESIAVSKSAYSRVTEQEIWDAPIFFLAIVVLLAAEWFIRRSRGLP
jgi:uncharacterized membrane protein